MKAEAEVKFGRRVLDLGETMALFAAGDVNSRGGSSRKLLATGYDAILCLNGTLKWSVFKKEITQEKGEFLLAPPGTYYELLGGDDKPIIVHLRIVEKGKSSDLLGDYKLGLYDVGCDILCSTFLNVSRDIVETGEGLKGSGLKNSLVEQSRVLYANLQEFLFKSHYCISEKVVSEKASDLEIMGKVYSEISKNTNITVEEISERLGMSASYLARLFKERSGVTPKQYINIYKVNKSLEGLNKSKLDLSELSIDMGFTDQSHFTNVFKKFLAMTPGELKKKSRAS